VKTGQQIWSEKSQQTEVTRIAFHPGGNVPASSSWNHLIQIWDAQTGGKIRSISHRDGANSVAFNRDGTLLASSGNNGQVLLWDTRDWTLVKTLRNRAEEMVEGIAFSLDGSKLAGASFGVVDIWDVKTGTEIRQLRVAP